MHKFIKILCIALAIIGLSSCSTDDSYEKIDEIYNNAYNEGYEHGYSSGESKGFEDGYAACLENESQECDFHSSVSELMYNHEYDVVKKLYEYYPKGVEVALEKEFGTTNIDIIIDYIEELSQTEQGICNICGKVVYADEFNVLPNGTDCAHSKCLHKNDTRGHSAYIEK